MMKKLFKSCLSALLILSLLCACAGGESKTAQTDNEPTKTLNITLDDMIERCLIDSAFEVEYQDETFTKYEATEDNLTYTVVVDHATGEIIRMDMIGDPKVSKDDPEYADRLYDIFISLHWNTYLLSSIIDENITEEQQNQFYDMIYPVDENNYLKDRGDRLTFNGITYHMVLVDTYGVFINPAV